MNGAGLCFYPPPLRPPFLFDSCEIIADNDTARERTNRARMGGPGEN